MSDQFFDLVEEKMKSSLSLELVSQPTTKSTLPFSMLNIDKSSPVVHLFQVPADKIIPGAPPSNGRSMFGAVTTKGSVLIYDAMFRNTSWKRESGLERVSWADLTWGEGENVSIMFHSRQTGFHLMKETGEGAEGSSSAVLNLNEPRCEEVHVGFCKPWLCSDLDVILPTTNFKIGLYNNDERPVQECHTFMATVMSVKEIPVDEEASKYFLSTTEDGFVHVIKLKRENGQATLITKMQLPCYKESDQPIGMCIEGLTDVFVVGTNLRYLFLFKWNKEEERILQPFGKKILPTDGVSCMAMMPGKNTLGVGCFDGNIRLFGFPEMNQIMAINFHKTQINTLLFMNEKLSKAGRQYLICGANDTGLSVWIIP